MHGQAEPSGLNPISPDTVLVAVTPSAPPSRRDCGETCATCPPYSSDSDVMGTNLMHCVPVFFDDSGVAVLTFLGCLGNSDNVCDIRRELSKERNLDCSFHPATNVPHQLSILP